MPALRSSVPPHISRQPFKRPPIVMRLIPIAGHVADEPAVKRGMDRGSVRVVVPMVWGQHHPNPTSRLPATKPNVYAD